MSSINDVVSRLDTANTTLGQIHADVLAETNATDQVKASVDHLDVDLTNGFNETTNELSIITQIDTAAVKLLFHLTQQADAMICALEHISQNTCGILSETAIQTGLQTQIRDDTAVLRDISEFAHPDAALERKRLQELHAEIERCCPPESPPPACTYQPCPHPKPIEEPQLPGNGQPKPPA
jgi:hypothetical protein